MTLEEIQFLIENDNAFNHMRRHFINYVPGRGNSASPKVMVVGEAPGEFENFKRTPFCGPAGVLLFDLMKLAKMTEDNCYITNVLKYRPIDDRIRNRTPTGEEIIASIPYLQQEWQAVNAPPVIVMVGTIAMKSVIPTIKSGIMSIAGNVISTGDFVGIPMVHPAYIIRNKQTQPTYEAQWRQLGRFVENRERDQLRRIHG